MNGNVFSSEGLAPTVTTNKGEGNKIAIRTTANLPQDEVLTSGGGTPKATLSAWTKPYSEKNAESQTPSQPEKTEEYPLAIKREQP